MVHFRILYLMALTLMVFSLFVLWVWTGPVGVVAMAVLAHSLFRICERQTDGQMALARKQQAEDLRAAFQRRG